ncbi:GlcG/HbpS family heme-binding protein [Riemerella anatipestifer]|uniref:GlcG/HbpS family heme-binding protein n=1 Tax=Weeksellaceae TaxID=2762318 RepID=UPI00129D4850|nr:MULTISPECIES: heme-binding protein [Weeksellaceae]MDY3520896.1 heme-binding protein [Riemerella anatipestifer]MDY3533342.1 heme-binding protein [Riemerella anatipestifer]MDY3536364.1 heme-binding protein [Riemerella anatipestifer]MEC5396082.1 heme-binding protein [Bergeyella sp. RCAD1439]MRM84304.1 heme-binding protein [Riemerella anatipestifer]
MILFLLIFPLIVWGQNSTTQSTSLNQFGALELAKQANIEALKLGKNVSIAVLDASGTVILLLKGDNVGPHNTEASKRKAFTALSTKTASLELMKKADASSSSKNLNTIAELLLLGGGVPVWKDGELIGSIGISGGGSGENDHFIAVTAIQNLNFKINY